MHILDFNKKETNINFQTSSGDKINISLLKAKKEEFQTNENGQSFAYSFASLERFRFEINHNGLSEQDKKEIGELMKLVKPIIEDFFNQKSEKTQNEASDFIASKLRKDDLNTENYAKSLLVKTFDDVMKENENQLDIKKQETFKDFLEDILYKMENFGQSIYG